MPNWEATKLNCYYKDEYCRVSMNPVTKQWNWSAGTRRGGISDSLGEAQEAVMDWVEKNPRK